MNRRVFLASGLGIAAQPFLPSVAPPSRESVAESASVEFSITMTISPAMADALRRRNGLSAWLVPDIGSAVIFSDRSLTVSGEDRAEVESLADRYRRVDAAIREQGGLLSVPAAVS